VKGAALLAALVAGAAVAGIALSRTGSTPPRRATTVVAPTTTVRRRLQHVAPPLDVYAYDHVGMVSRVAARALPRVYVPNSEAGSIDVIDPRTYRVVAHFAVRALPQHVTPAHDLRTLYVDDDVGNTLTPINPRTARPGRTISVDDPYNLYFTPNGRYAIVVAERLRRLDFRTPRTFHLVRSLGVPCAGVNHMDFSGNGAYAIVSCEFSGQLLKVDVRRIKVLAARELPRRFSVPQDVRAAPNAKIFYVADLAAGGVWEIDPARFKVLGFIRTGPGAHGLVVARNGSVLYVANRNAGSVSVISFRTRRVVRTWHIPGGGSPDMGDVSANGRVLWLSGRFSSEVYAISTRTGRLLARIHVGASPHGLSVWPQPGRYSLGHVGNMR
jgi:DNA-binding beta-propeller fold protein YncE